MSYDPDNIFTKIIAGDIPSHKVYEDDVCISIMDIMPEAPGHVLVVPKKKVHAICSMRIRMRWLA